MRHILTILILCLGSTSSVFGQAVNEQYEYDELGRLVKVIHPSATTEYVYDAADNRAQGSIGYEGGQGGGPAPGAYKVVVTPMGGSLTITAIPT